MAFLTQFGNKAPRYSTVAYQGYLYLLIVATTKKNVREKSALQEDCVMRVPPVYCYIV